jgi:glutamate synthase (NADPH/NADH) small chain
MGDPKGFLKTARETPRRRPVDVRISDWREVYEPFAAERAERQAARCMDCGIPFCHQGCPLGNLIPEWNDLVYKSDWAAAADRLHATNNFPEFTGRLCRTGPANRSRSSRSRSRSSTARGRPVR